MTSTQSEGSSVFVSVNPATGTAVGTYPGHTDEEVRKILEAVGVAQRNWAELSVEDRAVPFRKIAAHLRAEAAELSRLMAVEMGKPVAQGRAEILKCADNCDFYVLHAGSLLEDESLKPGRSLLRYQPLGTVLAVMPWNFPFWQVLRAAVPILMAGNAMVLKHASNVMGAAVAIEMLMKDAGLLPDVFRTLRITSGQVAGVIRHPVVAGVTLTGSEAAGRAVTEVAGAVLKPTVLELGGSDPFIVLADADIPEAARVGAWARNQNSGQSCIAAKRFLVEESVHDLFVGALLEHVRTLRMGDPLDPETELGPLAREDLRDDLHAQVVRSVESGATLLLGGEIPSGPGAYYPATILDDVVPGMAAFDEETFGPVAAIVRVRDEADAVRMANLSRFGLGASVWTGDLERGDRIASRIESGMVFINSMSRSDSWLPFGGIKASGFGRELWAPGIRSFTNAKTVYSE